VSAATQLAGFFARYEPPIARLGKALRTRLRKRLPGLIEVVYLYENQHVLLIAYSATGKGYEAPCSLALHPDEVRLCFLNGPQLSKADPQHLLQGRGKSVRHVVLAKAADFDRAEIQALVAGALKLAGARPEAGAKRAVVLKAEAQKQRARRAAGAARRTRSA
jgi:hypothetical protein